MFIIYKYVLYNLIVKVVYVRLEYKYLQLPVKKENL